MTLNQRSHVSFLSKFSKDLSFKTAEPVSINFHIQSSGKGGKKVYMHLFGKGHIPYMVRKLYSSSFTETTGPIALKLVM